MGLLKSKKQRKKVMMLLKQDRIHDKAHHRLMQRRDDSGISGEEENKRFRNLPKRPDNLKNDTPQKIMFRKKRNREYDEKKLGAKDIGLAHHSRGYDYVRQQRNGRGMKYHASAHASNALHMENGGHISQIRKIKFKGKGYSL